MAVLLAAWLSATLSHFATKFYWNNVTLYFRIPFLTKSKSFSEGRSWDVSLKVRHANFYTTENMNYT